MPKYYEYSKYEQCRIPKYFMYVQLVFQSIEPQNTVSTTAAAVFQSIEPTNAWITSSIQSIQPGNTYKYKQ